VGKILTQACVVIFVVQISYELVRSFDKPMRL